MAEAFSTTCVVHIEDCEGLWLSQTGCRGSVAEHWRLKPEVSWVQPSAAAGLFTFLYFHIITSKFIYFQREARCSEQMLCITASTFQLSMLNKTTTTYNCFFANFNTLLVLQTTYLHVALYINFHLYSIAILMCIHSYGQHHI